MYSVGLAMLTKVILLPVLSAISTAWRKALSEVLLPSMATTKCLYIIDSL